MNVIYVGIHQLKSRLASPGQEVYIIQCLCSHIENGRIVLTDSKTPKKNLNAYTVLAFFAANVL